MRLRYTALIALILYSQLSYTQDFKSKNFQIKKLSPHVYAAIATDGGGAICNAGVVDLGNEVLVFDPFLTPDAAIELKDFIAKAIRKPVKWVVNSHSHNDHIRGTQVFSGARVIATPLIRQIIEKTEPVDIADEKNYVPGRIRYYDSIPRSKDRWQAEEDAIWKGYYKSMGASHKVLKTVLPDLLFDDSLTLYGKQTIVKLISYGDGHTPSDLFLYLPQEKIIFAGDLLFVDYHAWVGESKVDRWIDYLKKMHLLDVNVYIPGHGPEGNANSVATMIRYFETLNASVAKLKGQANLSNKEIDDQMPAEFKNWHLRMFYAFNIKYLLRN